MKKQRSQLKGIPASPGKFYGQVLKLISSSHIILNTEISEAKVEQELEKFLSAIKKTKKELESIIEKSAHDIQKELKDILVSQIVMLDDPLLLGGVEKRIRNNLENAPLALFHEIERISGEFEEIEDEYFRERAEDIRDIGKRIENNLLGKKSDHSVLASIKEPVVIIATELTPSQILHIDKKQIKGIATEKGGRTGHMAILAKYFEIPAVVGIPKLTDEIIDKEKVLVDGDLGLVIRNPSQELIQACLPLEKSTLAAIKEKIPVQTFTKDGERILVKANLESENNAQDVLRFGADGVGLYRSEILIMKESGRTPSEEEQLYVYKKIAITLENKPFILRTFDVGADKMDSDTEEANPFLGNRGIRYSLRKKEWFKKQLRAILRANAFGNIWMLIPMVNELREILELKELIQECKSELIDRGHKFKNPKLGVMVETPSCALNLEIFAKECDFFSVGTNDLLQYITAVDRNHPALSNLYNPFNYAFLKTLVEILQVSKKHKIPVGICGELASDLKFTTLLIGLGFRELSVSLPLVRKVKKIISNIDMSQSKKLAKQILALSANEQYSELESFLFHQHLLN
ncbi:MAG: phosphoenolpyruvate--protein phosphotransferase [Leptospiraceae bacterium]|nr:phosphoenolpyruvate--protein phosphotransferase [Leptospiraceae bacterium]